MVGHYVLAALRHLRREKFHSLVALVCLAIGIGFCAVAISYVRYELSYDCHNEKRDRIFRVTWEGRKIGAHYARIAYGWAPSLKANFPAIEEAARLWEMAPAEILQAGKPPLECRAFAAEASLLDILTIRFIWGDPGSALDEPRSVVLSQSMAEKLSLGRNPVGKDITLVVRGQYVHGLRVRGIFEDIPRNSHLRFDSLCSFDLVEQLNEKPNFAQNWAGVHFYTYVLLVEEEHSSLLHRESPSFIDRLRGKGASDAEKLHFQGLTDIHLYSHLKGELAQNGSIGQVYAVSGLGLVLLLVSSANYMSIAASVALRRIKEVGVRKVVGAQRHQIAMQLLCEAVGVSVLSLILGVAGYMVCLPWLQSSLSTEFTVEFEPTFVVLCITLATLVGLISGSYPALLVTRRTAIEALAPGYATGPQRLRGREIMVVGQFTAAIALLVCMLITHRQVAHLHTQGICTKAENTLVIPLHSETARASYAPLKAALLGSPGILAVTASLRHPAERADDIGPVFRHGEMVRLGDGSPLTMPVMSVDPDFFSTLGVTIIAGRGFPDHADAGTHYILNTQAVRSLGWSSPQDALGEEIAWRGLGGRVIGVAGDFHFGSLRERSSPKLFVVRPAWYFQMLVRLRPPYLADGIASVARIWDRHLPDDSFEYSFLADIFDELYANEEKQRRIFALLSVAATVLACLGIIGLSSTIARQRTREFGIRRALGASSTSNLLVSIKYFAGIVLIANALAWPIAYWLMGQWLQGFANRVQVGPDVFLIAGLLATIVALMASGIRVAAVAVLSPIDALGRE